MDWDNYFLSICSSVAKNSKCLSRQIGAILIDDKSIISTGYNGPPRGIVHCGEWVLSNNLLCKEFRERALPVPQKGRMFSECCPRQVLGYKSGEGLHICPAAHAEVNAIVNAARQGVRIKGAKMYMDCPIPCRECMKLIINAGIEEIICTKLEYYDEMSKFLIENSDIKVRRFKINA